MVENAHGCNILLKMNISVGLTHVSQRVLEGNVAPSCWAALQAGGGAGKGAASRGRGRGSPRSIEALPPAVRQQWRKGAGERKEFSIAVVVWGKGKVRVSPSFTAPLSQGFKHWL